MKYSKMLCWVRPHEKKELISKIDNRFSVEFAKNYDDFIARITPDSYLVFSIVKAVRSIKKIQSLVRKFPDIIFHLFYRSSEDGFMTDNELTLFEEANIAQKQYMSDLVISEFLTH
jgi:hypothetical protein